MANNILIIPGQAKIEFSGSLSSNIELQVLSNGDIGFVGTTAGSLLNISEDNNKITITQSTQIQDQLYLGTGSITASGSALLTGTGISNGLTLYNNTGNIKRIWNDDSDDSLNITIGDTKNNGFRLSTTGEGYLGNNRILTTADSGGEGGIDASTLDSYDSSDFTRKIEDAIVSGNWNFIGLQHFSNIATRISGFDISNQHTIKYSADATDLMLRFTRNGINDYSLELFEGGSAATVWTSANDGTGSGLDADLLDGYQATAFPRKDEDAIVSGNWNFTGQTTFVDTTIISTGDNIMLLNNDVTGVPTENAGIEIERGTSTNVQWLWDETNDYWSPMGDHIGGVADPLLDTHIGDRGYNDARYAPISHTHLISEITNLQSNLDDKLNASVYTAADVLSKLLTVDGAVSGVDADLLDGQHGSYYLAASAYTAADVLSKLLTVDGAGSGVDADTLDGINGAAFVRKDVNSQIDSNVFVYVGLNEGTMRIQHVSTENRFVMTPYDGGSYADNKEFSFDADEGYWKFDDRLDVLGALNVSGNVTLQGTLSSPSDPTLGSHVGDRDYNDARYGRSSSSNIWTQDQILTGGPGALRLKSDGVNDHVYMEFFARDAALITRSGYFGYGSSSVTDLTLYNEISGGNIAINTTSGNVTVNGSRVLTIADEGSGNGIDADTLDGLEASQFIRSDLNDTISTNIEITWGTGEGAIVSEHISAENRFRMTPYDGGSFDTSKDFTFDADVGYWEFKNQLYVGTILHANDEVQTKKVSIDDTSNNKKFEIVYNSVSDSLDFNFVG